MGHYNGGMHYLVELRELEQTQGPAWCRVKARVLALDDPGNFDRSDPFNIPAELLDAFQEGELLLGFVSVELKSESVLEQTERLA